MANGSIYYVGTRDEVAHHAAPLQERLPIQIVSPESIVDRAQPGDLALFFSEHFDRFRQAIIELKSRNVATLYAIDGILEWRNAWETGPTEPACPWTMRPVLSHKVACIGPSQARFLSAWGNRDRVELVGLPRLDGAVLPVDNPPLVHSRLEQSQRRRSQVPTQVGPVAGTAAEPFRLLIMTAKCPAYTEQQRHLLIQSLLNLKNWLAHSHTIKGRRVEPIWRLTADLELAIEVDNCLTELTGEELAEQLGRVDAVITTPSTAQLEAWLRGRPTCLLNFSNSPKYVPAVWEISAASQLDQVLPELAAASAEKMFLQRTYLLDSLCCDGRSAERMCELIQRMMAEAQSQTASTKLSFGRDLLTDRPDHWMKLEHSQLFSNYPEFAQTDCLELQAQLAHARREIAHLHRQIDSLQAELSQAHAIFEQIQKHPIAGPVVRTRQKILDWIENRRQVKTATGAANPVGETTEDDHAYAADAPDIPLQDSNRPGQ